MKTFKYFLLSLTSLILLTACEDDNFEVGDLITPTNVKLDFNIVGQDNDNPYGDGSGKVNFIASADNAINYKFIFGDGSNDEMAPSGSIQHRFSQTGDVTYVITVLAYGTAGISSSTSVQVKVNSAFEDLEVVKFLAGENVGDSKIWYWAYDEFKHVGMGPFEDDYGNGQFAYEDWWSSIQPYDEEKSCMYEDEFLFTKTEDGLTFEQTQGPAYIPGYYANQIGVEGETCHGEDVVPSMYGEKDVSIVPSTSKAALEGSYDGKPYRGTSFKISLDGFMGWYVGTSEYDIISISETEMRVRVITAGSPYGDGGAAWYHKFTTEKPE